MSAWESHETVLGDGRVRRITIGADGVPLSFAQVLEGWRKDAEFRRFYVSILAQAPFEALFWETPALTRHSLDRSYECVLVNSPQLAEVAPDPDAFQSHFRSGCDPDGIVAFPNLGNDALLLVPCPLGNDADYAHLASFLRHGPTGQVEALFRRVGEALNARLGERPVWVSTSGLGVHWLHIRLDDRPKYYTYAPYRSTT